MLLQAILVGYGLAFCFTFGSAFQNAETLMKRCPVTATQLGVCAKYHRIELASLDFDACLNCLVSSDSIQEENDETNCARQSQQVCQSLIPCDETCRSVAGPCDKEMGNLLACELEQGLQNGNCTIFCSSGRLVKVSLVIVIASIGVLLLYIV